MMDPTQKAELLAQLSDTLDSGEWWAVTMNEIVVRPSMGSYVHRDATGGKVVVVTNIRGILSHITPQIEAMIQR